MVNYALIHYSNTFYVENGFQRIESPWTVTHAIANITKPPESSFWTIAEKNKVLVASGEQGFLYLNEKGFLPKGKFQTTTPCFRDDTFDDTHTKYFIKTELIQTNFVTEANLLKMVEIAEKFFHNVAFTHRESVISGTLAEIERVSMKDGSIDIMMNGVEVGSYGIRQHHNFSWIYGTGCAEPRLSKALNRKSPIWNKDTTEE